MNQHQTTSVYQSQKLIESDDFPIEFLSLLAERESWRKEIYRPIYHMHKWWAKRLGSIFRGLLLGSLLPHDANFEEEFYRIHHFDQVTIFDPFMGSGTTVGEAHKLGCTVLGRDINPIACESVRIALGPLDQQAIQQAYMHLAEGVGKRIRDLYRAKDADGNRCDVLYFFWVKTIECPGCFSIIDLFSTRIIARNAYPQQKPEVQVCCPTCSAIFPALYTDNVVCCPVCQFEFDLHSSNVKGAKAICSACQQSFSIAKVVQASTLPPEHRLYAKLVLTSDGEKQYLPITAEDIYEYQACKQLLADELATHRIKLPKAELSQGYNTRQALNYNYKKWSDFFNDRQLLALTWLQSAIDEVTDITVKDLLFTIFSGVLEFNNLFATYKGEGTGAVRHMFSHHILKPERMPIEANVWGTPKSSGSFSTLLKMRIQRATDYRQAPFEVKLTGSGKAFYTSLPFSGVIEEEWPVHGNYKPRGLYLSCGSSDETGLPTQSIDFIITDPPFFDNVHYSELADFFLAWQSLKPHGFITDSDTTRHLKEVQDGDEQEFTQKLKMVFCECHRILKQDGLLLFSYHHSRSTGWKALSKALVDAGFSVVNTHPLKAELSVAAPKTQASEPIQLDIVFVCKKIECDQRSVQEPHAAFIQAQCKAQSKLDRLASCGLKLSFTDRKITLLGQFMAQIGPIRSSEVMQKYLTDLEDVIDKAVATLEPQELSAAVTAALHDSDQIEQLVFSFAD